MSKLDFCREDQFGHWRITARHPCRRNIEIRRIAHSLLTVPGGIPSWQLIERLYGSRTFVDSITVCPFCGLKLEQQYQQQQRQARHEREAHAVGASR